MPQLKKTKVFIAITMVLLGLLTSCGVTSQQPSASNSPASSTDSGETEIPDEASKITAEDYIQQKIRSEDFVRRKLKQSGQSTSAAFEEKTAGSYQYKLYEEYSVITKYLGTNDISVSIPSELGGKPVRRIAASAFEGLPILESVIMPDTITSLSRCVFKGCTSLTNIHISSNLESISDSNFAQCTALQNIDLSNCKLRVIANHSFWECSALMNVRLPNTLETIDSQAFGGCSALANISIPNAVSVIDDIAFYGTPWIENQTEEFTVVGNGVLIKYNGPGGNVTIPENVRFISDAFRHNKTITNVSIPTSVSIVGDYAFLGCSAIQSVSFPDTLLAIGDSAFGECSSLSTVYIPDSVQYISEGAFSDCKSLWSVHLPNTLEYIPYHCFSNCTINNIVLPTELKYIGEAAFAGNKLRTVYIPETVNEISERVFDNNISQLFDIRCKADTFAYDYANANEYGITLVDNNYIETKVNESYEYDCYKDYVILINYCGEEDSKNVRVPFEVDGKMVFSVSDTLF